MAELRYAQIRFKNRVAGTLQETPSGGTLFEYSPDFGEQIGCALPRQQDRHAWDTGLHPFFEHLGPEGWLRDRQAQTAEIPVEDEFGILLEYGADCIGAVSVHNPTPAESKIRSAGLDPMTRAAVQSKRTISGIQPKILVNKKNDRYYPAAQEDPAPYIAKIPSDDVPDMVLNEDISLKAARIFLGPDRVTEAERGFVQGIERAALLVKRFDRTAEYQKLRLEDFMQILCKPKRRDFSGKYDGDFNDIADAIRLYSIRPEIDILFLFQQLLVFAILGNCDCHLKNFSLLETRRGLRLAPAYDVVNTYVYGKYGYSTRFGIRISGKHHQFDDLNQSVFAEFGRAIGLNPVAIDKTFNDIGSKREEVFKLVGGVDASRDNEMVLEYDRTMRGAFARICD